MNGVLILQPSNRQEVLTLMPGQIAVEFDCRRKQQHPRIIAAGQPTLRQESALWVVMLQGAVLVTTPTQESTTGICSIAYHYDVRVAQQLPAWATAKSRPAPSPAGSEFLSLMLDPRNLDVELRSVLRPVFFEAIRRHAVHEATLQYLDTLLDMDVPYYAENQAEYERRATQARTMLDTLAAELKTYSSDWMSLFDGLLEARFTTDHAVIDAEIFHRFERMEQKIEAKINRNFEDELRRSQESRANMALFIDLVTRTQPASDQIPVLMDAFMSRLQPRVCPPHLSHVPIRRTAPPSHSLPPGGIFPPVTGAVTPPLSKGLAPGFSGVLIQAQTSLQQALSGGTPHDDALEAAIRDIGVRTIDGKTLDTAERLQQLRAWLVVNMAGNDPMNQIEGFLRHLLDRGCMLEARGNLAVDDVAPVVAGPRITTNT